ncbi:MCP four helix bundle domain-containing protein, partial [Magnetospirillum aberrantis]
MRLTIKLKLVLGFGLVIALAAVSSGLGVSNLGQLHDAMAGVVDGPAERQKQILQMQVAFVTMVRAEKSMILATDAETIRRYDGEILGGRDRLQRLMSDYRNLATEDGRRRIDQFAADLSRFIASQDRVRDAVRAGVNDGQAAELSRQGRSLVDSANNQLDDLVRINEQLMDTAVDGTNQDYLRARTVLLSLLAVSVAIALGISIWIALSVSRGLGKALGLAQAVAQGDLDHRVAGAANDEIGDVVAALDRMVLNLRDTVQVAEQISLGDLSVQAKVLSDKDTLGHALTAMLTNLRATAGVADRIAQGDLTVQPKRLSDKDTLGMALETMVEKLREVVADANAAAENVAAGSQELSASSEQLSQGAT